ncbi:MAG TPA: APC family permease [Solirubrobacteraceae bacterium]|nr:APC family permease [Solirubrobacteraceae bacterium]
MSDTRATPDTGAAPPQHGSGLRRELRFWEAIALSIAIMAPTAAMALNGTAPAGLIGHAVPLAFIFATIGVAFVSYAFIRLSRHYSHAGSVFAFSGVTLGPRAGFFAGWALMGTYFAFTCASTAEAGTFGVAFLGSTGIAQNADYVVIALAAAVIIAVLAFGDIKVATRSLLGFEGISVLLIIALMVVIVVRLIAGSAPGHQSINADVFSIPHGTKFSAVAFAATFGFLSFAGFEGAASLGEETDNPRREIPRAIRNAVVGTGVFYILCILVQTWGFGTGAAGVKAFSTSPAPLGQLAHVYVGTAMSDCINAGATLSAFASGLASATAAGRILFALSRDTPLRPLLGTTSARSGAPVGALTVALLVGVGAIVGQRIAGVNAVNAFFYPGTLGVLSLLVAYIVTNLGAIRHLFIAARRAPLYEIVFPVIGIVFLVYTIDKNVVGVAFPYSRFWIVVAGWLLAGLAIILASPRLAARIGRSLAADEGLATEPESPAAP